MADFSLMVLNATHFPFLAVIFTSQGRVKRRPDLLPTMHQMMQASLYNIDHLLLSLFAVGLVVGFNVSSVCETGVGRPAELNSRWSELAIRGKQLREGAL
jgi:hypothetical protein